MIVANPVDILTQVAVKLSGFPENRVFGSGTTLDSARLKYLLGEHLQVDARSVHAWIIGEHGDSEIVAWSSANVSGVPISEFCEMRGYTEHDEHMEEIAQGVKNSAYKIIEKKKQHIMELQWLSEESVKQSSEMKNLYYQYLLSNMIPMELKVLH